VLSSLSKGTSYKITVVVVVVVAAAKKQVTPTSAATKVEHPATRNSTKWTRHQTRNITSNKRKQRKRVNSWSCGMHSAFYTSTKAKILPLFLQSLSSYNPLSKKLL